MNRWDIINSFIEKHNYKSYLEIGYYKGWSFDQVKGPLIKVAVDPNPSKLDKDITMPYGERRIVAFLGEFQKDLNEAQTEVLYKLTSDDFFNEEKDSVFDIIFIDGLHEASQVEKDIKNSLNHLSPRGTIILHDCNPPQYEHTTTGIDGCWTGDTYKAWLKYRAESPYLTYTIDTDWGVGVIDTKKSAIIHGDLGYMIHLDEIYNIQWEGFNSKRIELLNLISIEDFKTRMNERTTDTDSTA